MTEAEQKWRLILRDGRLLKQFYRKNVSITLWTGNYRNVLCPFHNDRNPSAHVHSDQDGDRLYCHSCDRQYDSFDYVKTVLQLQPRQWVQQNFKEEDLLKAAEEFKVLSTIQGSNTLGAGDVEELEGLPHNYEGSTPQERIRSYYSV